MLIFEFFIDNLVDEFIPELLLSCLSHVLKFLSVNLVRNPLVKLLNHLILNIHCLFNSGRIRKSPANIVLSSPCVVHGLVEVAAVFEGVVSIADLSGPLRLTRRGHKLSQFQISRRGQQLNILCSFKFMV